MRLQGRVRLLIAAAASIAVTACSGGVLDPLGPVGRDDATILIDATVIMLAICIPTILLTFWVFWRYRASNPKAEYLPNWSYSGRIEAVVWAIPILTIMFIGGVIWIGSYKLDPFKPLASNKPALEVQVVSLDWKWLFIYPEQHIATVNQLVVPAGRSLHFSITSASVFNTFFVPQLGSMIYAMPGMVSQLYLQADRPAQMLGQSAHFSGDGFSDMQFQVRSVPDAEFNNWVSSAKNGAMALDRPAYDQLARQSQHVKPYSYASVDPQLFQAVASQKIPPGPGPEPENPSHAGREVSSGGHE
jgi:cytochrome o ubiquinol oxidase subunit 2